MSKLDDVINLRDEFFEEEERLYLGMVNQINTQMKDLLKNDLGNQFVQNCARDFSGEIVRMLPVGQTGNMYITADQMLDRILHFSYENDIDPLSSNDQLRKDFYNNENRQELDRIIAENDLNQAKLFTEDRSQDKLDREGKLEYRASKIDSNGDIYDEITGVKGDTSIVEKNGKEVLVSDMHADHIQSREAATYNSQYMTEKGVMNLKQFYNSSDNFQIMHASANTSKGDVRVYDKQTGADITHKATPEQLAEATFELWEKETRSGKKIEKLKEKGYLDENGKVKPEVKKKYTDNIRKSMNAESITVLKGLDYGKVGHAALKRTANAFYAILAGQLMYYGVPPVIYETRLIITQKDTDLDSFFVKIQKAFQRVINYMQSKMKDILSNVAHNSLKTFLRNFFDIIIGMLKATVKRVMKMIKQVVMALVNSIKIIGDKNKTAAEKADAVFTTLGITISGIVVNVLLEYVQKQFQIPEFIITPLEIITTVLTTNIVMLILQKIDIFNVRYGLMMKKIKEIFEEEREEYKAQLKKLGEETYANIDKLIDEVETDMFNIMTNIASLDVNENDMKEEIDKINKIFNMGIDLEKEWNQFAYNN
ncbi:hypothetical protein R4J17_06610 [Brachyspira intermedia]|uniref:hypothetical protein n=1 Tax=Brachyspira intermedia TaxID=84377 RepID=UPI00300517B2